MSSFQQNSDISQYEAVTAAAMLVSVGKCERVTLYTCFTVKSSEALYQYTLEGGHEKNTHKNVLPLQQLNTRLKVR